MCGRARVKQGVCLIFTLVPIVIFRLITFRTRNNFERVLVSPIIKNYRAQHRYMDGAQHQTGVSPPCSTCAPVMSGLLTPGYIFLF